MISFDDTGKNPDYLSAHPGNSQPNISIYNANREIEKLTSRDFSRTLNVVNLKEVEGDLLHPQISIG